MNLFPLLKLATIPTLFVVLGHAMALKMFPLYSAHAIYNADPSYAYLFNGLLLLDRHVPFHIDHPGTPLQMLAAAVVYLQWLWLKTTGTVNADVVTAAIANPESFLITISRVLLLLNAFALFFFGKKIHAASKSMFLAVFCQSSMLTYGLLGTKFLYPAPEALVAFASLCLMGVLAPIIFNQTTTPESQRGLAIRCGLFYGLGLAVKLTFLPMVGLFLLLKGWRNIAIAMLAALLAWLVGIGPILTRLPDFWRWISNLASHVGKYGTGSKGFVDTSLLNIHFYELLRSFPLFYAALVISTGYVAYVAWGSIVGRQTKSLTANYDALPISRDQIKTVLILMVVCVGQTLIVLKHFGQHYMIPALPIGFMCLAVLIKLFCERKPQLTVWSQTLIACCLLLVVVRSNQQAFAELKASRIRHNASNEQVLKELAKYTDPLLIGSYGCYLRQCGLILGIEFAPAIDKKIGQQLANYYSFNPFNRLFVIDGHGYYPLTVLQQFLNTGRPIFLIAQLDMPAFEVFNKEVVLVAEKQTLYRITGLANKN